MTREEIVVWLDELELVIDKSIEAMNASSDRIDELEAALREIEGGCRSYSDPWQRMRDIARAALDRK